MRLPALLRIALGVIAVARGLEAYRILSPLALPTVVKIPYVTWMPAPTDLAILSIVIVWLTAGITFAIGYRTQISGTLLTFAMAAGLLIDQQGYSNHLYLLTILVGLLTLSRPGGAWSFDLRRMKEPVTSLLWPLVLMKVQISVVYFFAAFTKLHEEYLTGRVLAGQLGGLVVLPEQLRVPRILMVLAISSVVVEAFLAVYLWHPEKRFMAVGAGVLLHGVIPFVMQPFLQLTVFSSMMLSSYLLFIPRHAARRQVIAPDGIARLVRRLDVLQVMSVVSGESVSTERDGRSAVDWQAATAIADELPAMYLIAPFLRLPGIRTWGSRALRGHGVTGGPKPNH
ncbi:MAG: HTTM domain-containing protein [Acidimicrobiia bacterium]|nr:HTTM domain-containing protein [Acidimicrobiia bacterium]